MIKEQIVDGFQNAPHRSLYHALGMTEEEMARPLIGVVCSYNEIVPGHINLDKIAQAVKLGVAMAGGTPIMFPAITVCDGIAMGHTGMKYSLVTRDLIADSTEAMVRAHGFDGLVMIPNCDKNVPGLLMAAARLNIPTVFVSGGPMLAGRVNGQKRSLSSMFEAVGAYTAGKLDECGLNEFEKKVCPTCGSCSGMYTANSMIFGLGDEYRSIVEYDGCVNLMKGAIQVAENFSTVSRTYANEIKEPFFAHGLNGVITANEEKMTGILNGIDEDVYSAKKDDKLFANFSTTNVEGKAICKEELQKMLNLPVRAEVPVISIITRLVSQKGLDLIKEVFEDILSEDVQVVILGTGDTEYEDYFKFVANRYENKCRTIIAYNKDLASKIYSGSDIFLMPSKHEPCGLSQMIACKYGTIPVVRATGGLADSITAFNDDERKSGNGFKFYNYNAYEMLYVVKDAIFTFGDKKTWLKLIKTAMKTDFTWKKSACEYEKLYDLMLK